MMKKQTEQFSVKQLYKTWHHHCMNEFAEHLQTLLGFQLKCGGNYNLNDTWMDVVLTDMSETFLWVPGVRLTWSFTGLII